MDARARIGDISSPRHQSPGIHQRSPEEWTIIGRRLRHVINSNAVMSLLPEGTWNAGGCLTLSDALHGMLPDARQRSLRSDRMIEHVVLDVGAGLLDADGFSSPERLLHRWRTFERVPNPQLEAFYRHHLPDGFDLAPPDRVLALRRMLRQRMPEIELP